MSYLDWRQIHDDMIEQVMSGMPDSWDDDDSAEHLVVLYVREIERRLLTLGGSLERYPEVQQ